MPAFESASPTPLSDVSALEHEARLRVARVADDPAGRVQLRRDFYRKFGFGSQLDIPTQYGYGTSELAFLQWEVDRGVLNAISLTGKGGSAWWRNVNLDFLYYSELAGLAHDGGIAADAVPRQARAWMQYFAQPTPKNWYRAHNTSIVSGYLGHVAEAMIESRSEQYFMNVVLYRVLYAQGLVEGIEMGRLGELLANPDLPSVDVMVHLPDFYPRHYPLSPADARHVMHRGHNLEEMAVLVLDDVCIMPHLTPLYKYAAGWAEAPDLCTYLINGEPVYPTRIARPWHHLLHRRIALFISKLWHILAGK